MEVTRSDQPQPGAIPIIDMRPFLEGDAQARQQVARAFGEAFENTGFAIIVNHGVSADLVQHTYDAAKAFFALPQAQKMQLNASEKVKGRGYLAQGIESVSATLNGDTPPDLCEALVFNAIQREGTPRGRPNIWPTEPAALSPLIRQWHSAMQNLCGQLMRMSALALDLDEHWFAADFEDPAFTLRFVNYPDQLREPLPGQLRYGAHHDYGGLTILRPDDAPGGLEICDSQGQWHAAPHVPDSFIINVGDLMQRWTNGRWRSTLHRVSNPSRALTGSTQRLSMVAFTGPNEGSTVTCLPSCCSADKPAQFGPVNAGEYVWGKLTASMDLPAKTAVA